MAYDACQVNIPPGTTLCTENHCSSFRETSTMAKYCKCIGWDGQPIKDCTPQGGSFPVEAGGVLQQRHRTAAQHHHERLPGHARPGP